MNGVFCTCTSEIGGDNTGVNSVPGGLYLWMTKKSIERGLPPHISTVRLGPGRTTSEPLYYRSKVDSRNLLYLAERGVGRVPQSTQVSSTQHMGSIIIHGSFPDLFSFLDSLLTAPSAEGECEDGKTRYNRREKLPIPIPSSRSFCGHILHSLGPDGEGFVSQAASSEKGLPKSAAGWSATL